jgi:glyoxylase-like metal-dependent hydrolase (beta-lactamase superfamily II)
MAVETELAEVAEGLFELRLPIPFEDSRVNVFLLAADGEVDMVDCGMSSPDSVAAVRDAISTVGGPGATLRRLVITHIHPDHYGAAGVLAADPHVELYMHRLEVPMVHPRYLELEQLVAEVGRHLEVNGAPEADAEVLRNASRSFREFVKPALPAVQLDGAETVELGGRRFRIEWTPGHSPGHICLFEAASGTLLAGDQLLPDISPNIGLHPQSTPDPLDDFLESLSRLAALSPTTILPAHGRPFHDAASRVEALTRHHRRRKDQMVEIVGRREMTAWDVAVAVWGRRSNIYERRLAFQEALAHLQSLAVEGRLEKLVTPDVCTWRVTP